mmetsp:Transcript_75395/g.196456  ORF Transcript_75395/g.196456 Transcript_75395/m.196456 type:complete len:255 (-) Transcript_75395:34-798(-)
MSSWLLQRDCHLRADPIRVIIVPPREPCGPKAPPFSQLRPPLLPLGRRDPISHFASPLLPLVFLWPFEHLLRRRRAVWKWLLSVELATIGAEALYVQAPTGRPIDLEAFAGRIRLRRHHGVCPPHQSPQPLNATVDRWLQALCTDVCSHSRADLFLDHLDKTLRPELLLEGREFSHRPPGLPDRLDDGAVPFPQLRTFIFRLVNPAAIGDDSVNLALAEGHGRREFSPRLPLLLFFRSLVSFIRLRHRWRLVHS